MKIVDIKNNYLGVLNETVKVINKGGLVVFPSDTVYILAVDPTNKLAVKKLLLFKERWTGKAISIAVLNKKMALDWVKLSENAQNIYSNLLPGPFTVISKGKHKVEKGIEAENGTLGIRIPDNKYIHDLVEKLGGPITATSANLSGRIPHYSIESFLKTLPKKKKEMIDLIVDAGKLPRNKPSTVIDTTEPELKVLRRGDLIVGSATQVLISKSVKETEKIAGFLLTKVGTHYNAFLRQKPIVFGLSGDLGCGKTVFSRKVGHILGVTEKITSPTFVIYNEYEIRSQISDLRSQKDKTPLSRQVRHLPLKKGKNIKFLHFDLYRITSDYELDEIKFFDQFTPGTIACIEWPENMGKKNLEKLKKIVDYKAVNFEYVDERTREIRYQL